MKRKEEKQNDDAESFADETRHYSLIRTRRPEHDRALERLKSQFGRKHFDQVDAHGVGVAAPMLKELVLLGSLVFTKNRYRLNRAREAVNEYTTPVHHFRQESVMSRPESRVLALAQKDSAFREKCEPVSTRSAEWQPGNVYRHVRMSKKLDEAMKVRFGNISAYIRYLVCTDLGMERDAEREKRKMDPLV